MIRRPPRPPLFPYTPLSRSLARPDDRDGLHLGAIHVARQLEIAAAVPHLVRIAEEPVIASVLPHVAALAALRGLGHRGGRMEDRKSTRLNSSHLVISYAVFC